jgi:hypothetical protein
MESTIRKLQKELLKIKLENLKMQGNFLRVSRRLLEQGMTQELREDLDAVISKYKINRNSLIDYMAAMNIDPDTTSDAEVKRVEQEEKQRLSKEWKREQLLEDVTPANNLKDDPLGFGILITKKNINEPGVVMQRSINENNVYDKDMLIDILTNMNYKEFKSFCNHIRKLQEFADFNSGVWVTDVPHKLQQENLNLFWQISYPWKQEDKEDLDDLEL